MSMPRSRRRPRFRRRARADEVAERVRRYLCPRRPRAFEVIAGGWFDGGDPPRREGGRARRCRLSCARLTLPAATTESCPRRLVFFVKSYAERLSSSPLTSVFHSP